MKTVRNTTHKPLAVALPGGKKLHLGPGKSGEISAHAVDHPPLAKLITEGALEVVGEGERHLSAGGASSVHGGEGAHRQGGRMSRRGDRGT